jgi:hypothetical protein
MRVIVVILSFYLLQNDTTSMENKSKFFLHWATLQGHTQQLVNGFTSVWEESKAELLAACDRLSS